MGTFNPKCHSVTQVIQHLQKVDDKRKHKMKMFQLTNMKIMFVSCIWETKKEKRSYVIIITASKLSTLCTHVLSSLSSNP